KWGDNPDTTSITEYRGYFKWKDPSTSSSADYGLGTEKWAFIPANLISRLKNNLLSGDDQAYVDASPAISDVEIGGAWKTVLLSAEGNGGDTVFCLDVTDPYNPTFLWEFADPELFRSRSSPAVAVIGRTLYNGTKTWVAFFVSGKTYDNTLYPSIYMIDVATGNLLKRVSLN
ncbi:MAG: PilC/PilY family type IV pilus protein, partial [Deltaproteobacteria bacterium]|nr:PilC/PilY family type IV pilus protein [Deltaproteobacteria bacterium]